MSREEAALLLQRGLLLEYLTIAWSVLSAVVSTAAGIAAGSIALIGFGIDSLIEVLAGAVVVWQLWGVSSVRDRRTLVLIGVALVSLAGYVSVQALIALLTGSKSQAPRQGSP